MSASETILGVAAGLAIVLVAIVSAFVASHRVIERVAAERASAFRNEFVRFDLPDVDDVVQVMLDRDPPEIVSAVHDPDRGWLDPRTRYPVSGDIVGWRTHPFNRRPSWSPHEDLMPELVALLERGGAVRVDRLTADRRPPA